MQFFDWFDSEETQETVRGTIEQLDQRARHPHEHQGRSREASRNRFGLGDSEILGSKLTKDHLRNGRKHERQGDSDADSRRLADPDRFKQWPDCTGKNRLGNETEHQRRDRDAELRRA
jgi:G3E family GTPase